MRRPRTALTVQSCDPLACTVGSCRRSGRKRGPQSLASAAVGTLLLFPCAALIAHTPHTRGCASLPCFHRATTRTQATSAPGETKAKVVLSEDEPVDMTGVLDDLAREDDWEGHEYGFDWYLEQARRGMTNPGFTPLRMSFWKPVEQSEELSFFDTAYILLRNIGQMMGLPSVDNAPVAKIDTYRGNWLTFLQKISNGRLEDLAGGPLFLMLEKYFLREGPVYKLAFGPRSFIVVSDPVMAKHVLKSNVGDYDKGVLASILEPIMGKGLIPADPETWKVRRRAIVPGFHKRWLNRMMRLFSDCVGRLITELETGVASRKGEVVDMEEKFCSLSLDIIGRAVFNYEFDSVTNESPVIKAVYRVLREAEHRSSSFIPYWKIPYAENLLPSQKEFTDDMRLLNDVLDKLIAEAMYTQEVADVEDLERRDLDSMEDPSLLRFLIDMRGEDTTSRQLRDDLMTMLIAGHETTAAMLTWTLFNLVQNPECLARVRAEVDSVLADDEQCPTFDDLPTLKHTRLCLVEALRLYPEPPVLIRRALKETELPQGGTEGPVRLVKGTDVFISTWNLHRSPHLWDRPAEYRPERFLEVFQNPGVKGWAGYNPKSISGLYPNEIVSDFSFLPFGGGGRKCVGDQFAMMEATVTMAMLLKRFDFHIVGSPNDVGMVTGATIHTENGLKMTVTPRKSTAAASSETNGGGEGAEAGGGSRADRSGLSRQGINGDALNGDARHREVVHADHRVGLGTIGVSTGVPAASSSGALGGCPMHAGSSNEGSEGGQA